MQIDNNLYMLYLGSLLKRLDNTVLFLSEKYSNPDLQKQTQLKQMEKILSFLPGNFFWKDLDGVYLGYSDHLLKSMGFDSAHDIVGKTDWDLWPDKAAGLIKNDQQVMHTGETLFLEEEVILPGNEIIYFTVIKMPLLDELGRTIGILGTALDITELKKTKEALQLAKEKAESASRVKTEFIANMGHDIRTPLTGIIGYSDYLAQHIKDRDNRKRAKEIHASGEQLLELLNGVLDMITEDATKEHIAVQEPFDLHQLILDILNLERPAAKIQHLTIESHIDPKVPRFVLSDKMKLHRILLNLAGNAIKFTKKGGVRLNIQLISLHKEKATIKFTVKDTGIGIPVALQSKVFDRFYKVNPSIKGLQVGHGIGLYIAHSYVSLLGGQLQLKSQPAVGTAFYFTLEMKISSQTDVLSKKNTIRLGTQPTIIKNKKATLEDLSLLLVEDNIPALNVLSMMLEPYTQHIITADSAESALKIIQKNEFDLIITDLGLPGVSGDEMTQSIRILEQKQHRSACFIVGLTGYSSGEIIQICLDAGMDEIYEKPMTKRAIEELINRFKAPDTRESKPETITPSLPNETSLFEIDRFPLFDIDLALKRLGTKKTVMVVFNSFNEKGILVDLSHLKEAYAKGNWTLIGDLAHKMKSSAMYGTVRLHQALLFLEQYQKMGNTKHLEALYDQAVQTIHQTMDYINQWLEEPGD